MRIRSILLCAGLFGGGGCASSDDVAEMPLVDNRAWRQVDEEPAALAIHAPDVVSCAADSWLVTRDGLLDIDTGECEYLRVAQPALRALEAGSAVTIHFAHLQLFDPLTVISRGHIALATERGLLWERYIAIPASAQAYAETVELPDGVRRGERLFFHLHNHGANEWKLLDIAVPSQ